MRDFFIKGFEILVTIFIILMGLGIVLTARAVAFGDPTYGINGMPMRGGPLAGLGIFIAGAVYLIFVAGFMYLGLGIYDNTRRAAEALEKLVTNSDSPSAMKNTAKYRMSSPEDK